jgi:tetratricopeptide (TPR) repeat protein
MIRLPKHIFFLTASLFLFSSVFAQKNKDKKKKGAESYTQEQIDKITAIQLDAEKAKLMEDSDEAIKKYRELLEIDNKNANAYYQIALIHFQKNKIDDALFEAEEAVKYDPGNKWYTELLAKSQVKSGKIKEAIKTYESLIQKNPLDAENYFDLAYLYLQSNLPLNAVKTYDQFEKNYGVEESVVLQKEKIYLKLNMFEKAVAEIQKLIDAYPDDAEYLSMMADLYALNGKKEMAVPYYQKILNIDPENAQALLSLADINSAKGDTTARIEGMRKVFANPNMNIDAKIRMLFPFIQYYEIRKAKIVEAQELSQILVQTHPDQSKAFAIKGDVFYIDQKDDTALVAYLKALELQKDIFTVWQQVFAIYSNKREWAKIEALTTEALEYFPNQAIVYLYKGNAEYQLKSYDKALKTFTKGEKMCGDNNFLRAQMFASIGDIHYNLQQHEQSDSAFEKSLKYNPDNSYTLNNYSYYLSLRKANLEKAKQMSAYSNKIEPDNSSFQDTYAWILFELGDYKEAKIWQEKALKSDTTNATLLEHYADILIKLGETEKALEYWNKAKKADSDSKTLDKKIATKSYVE